MSDSSFGSGRSALARIMAGNWRCREWFHNRFTNWFHVSQGCNHSGSTHA
jgi:hypothetical protein